MLQTIEGILITALCGLACYFGAKIIKNNKQNLINTITTLVQNAETAIQGTGMGAEKKAKVIATLEAMGIEVTVAVSAMIDSAVNYLNAKSAFFTATATTQTKEVVEQVATEVTATEAKS